MFKTKIASSDFFSNLKENLDTPIKSTFVQDLNKEALQNLVEAWKLLKNQPKFANQTKNLQKLIQIKLANKQPTIQDFLEIYPETEQDIIEI